MDAVKAWRTFADVLPEDVPPAGRARHLAEAVVLAGVAAARTCWKKKSGVSSAFWSRSPAGAPRAAAPLTALRLVAGFAVEAVWTDADEALPLPRHACAAVAAVVHLAEVTCGRRSASGNVQVEG